MEARGRWGLRWALVVLGVVLVVAGLAVGGVSVAAGTPLAQEAPTADSALDDADKIQTDVHLHENGSATFTVDYRYTINDENLSQSGWEQLETDIEENPEPFVEEVESGWSETLADAENETDREEMALSPVTASTDESTAPRDMGHVEFRFVWESFAHVELNRIEAGDALSGFTIQDDTSIQLHWPEEYTLYEEPSPTPDERNDNSVYWDDEGSGFDDDEPRLVLIENGSDGTADGTGMADENAPADEQPAMPWVWVAGALLLLASVGAVGWWIRDQQVRTVVDEPTRSTETDDNSTPPPELLSNEERVMGLIDSHGGRIKQQEVVSELGWTEAKTSQVVSRLRDADEIEVFRIGRENVLTLPDEDDDQ